MTTVSELKYPVYLQEDPPTPLSLLPTISQNSDLVLLALPAFAIRTTDTQLYPSFTAKLPGTSSWQASLNNATLYTVMSGTAKHLIHPLCVEVSVVPVGSSLVDGVTGYGVHVDINLLHVSLSKRKVHTSTYMYVCTYRYVYSMYVHNVCTCTYIHVYMYVHVHVHIYICNDEATLQSFQTVP